MDMLFGVTLHEKKIIANTLAIHNNPGCLRIFGKSCKLQGDCLYLESFSITPLKPLVM